MILVSLLVQLFLLPLEFFDLMLQLLSFAFQAFKSLVQFVELLSRALLEIAFDLALLVFPSPVHVRGGAFGLLDSASSLAFCVFLDPFHLLCIHLVLPRHLYVTPGFDLRQFFSIDLPNLFRVLWILSSVTVGEEGLDHFLQPFQPLFNRRICRFSAS